MKCQLIKSLRSTVITEATMKRQLKFFVSINENNVQTANTRNDDSFRSYNDNKNDTAGTGDSESSFFRNERNEKTAGIPFVLKNLGLDRHMESLKPSRLLGNT